MKHSKKWTYAYIDNENVNVSIIKQRRKIDREKLYKWLRKEHNVDVVKMFMGKHPDFEKMYDFFEAIGYKLIFRQMNVGGKWPLKGNIDTELVLEAMKDFPHYKKAIIVSGDWDFSCLVEYLRDKKKLGKVIVPNKNRYSEFLKEAAWEKKIESLTELKKKLRYNPNEEHETEYDSLDAEEEWPFWM